MPPIPPRLWKNSSLSLPFPKLTLYGTLAPSLQIPRTNDTTLFMREIWQDLRHWDFKEGKTSEYQGGQVLSKGGTQLSYCSLDLYCVFWLFLKQQEVGAGSLSEHPYIAYRQVKVSHTLMDDHIHLKTECWHSGSTSLVFVPENTGTLFPVEVQLPILIIGRPHSPTRHRMVFYTLAWEKELSGGWECWQLENVVILFHPLPYQSMMVKMWCSTCQLPQKLTCSPHDPTIWISTLKDVYGLIKK